MTRPAPAKPTVILPSFGVDGQVGNKLAPVNGAEYLAFGQRCCPCCGQKGALIGHGQRPRTYRLEPVRRGLTPPQTTAYRVLCKTCRHSHTVLPPGLGPHKRYLVDVIESAVRGVGAGEAIGRISVRLGGVSPERIATWAKHVGARLVTARLRAEALLAHDSLFALPPALPTVDVFAYLQGLLGIATAIGVLTALNRLFSDNPPVVEPLLAHPPTSSGRPHTPCRTAAAGGVPFG